MKPAGFQVRVPFPAGKTFGLLASPSVQPSVPVVKVLVMAADGWELKRVIVSAQTKLSGLRIQTSPEQERRIESIGLTTAGQQDMYRMR
jgi:hypothetical protein